MLSDTCLKMREEWGGVALVKLSMLLLWSKDRKFSDFTFFLATQITLHGSRSLVLIAASIDMHCLY